MTQISNKTDIATGFFTIDVVNEIIKAKTINEGKQIAFDAIKKFPNAKQKSIDKATLMVNNTTNISQLAFAVSNFILAHPSENLKLIV